MLAELARRSGRGYTAHAIRNLCPTRVHLPRAGTFALAWTAVDGGIRPDLISASDDSWNGRALGALLSNTPMSVALTQPWAWLYPYLGDAQGLVATVALATTLVGLTHRRPSVVTAHRIQELTERADVYIEQARRHAESLHSRLGGLVFHDEPFEHGILRATQGDWDDLILVDPSPQSPMIETLVSTVFQTLNSRNEPMSWNVPPDDPHTFAMLSMLAAGPRAFVYTAMPVQDADDPAIGIGPPWQSVFVDRPRTSQTGSTRWVLSNRALDVVVDRTDVESPGAGTYKLLTSGEITRASDLRAVRINRRVVNYYKDLLGHGRVPVGHTQRYYALVLDGQLLACAGVWKPKFVGDTGRVGFVFSPVHPQYPTHTLAIMSLCSSWFWETDVRDIEPIPTQVMLPDPLNPDHDETLATITERSSGETIETWMTAHAV